MAQVAYDVLHKLAPVVAEQFIFQNATTTQNELYGDLNMDHLNWLERKWASYYIWMGNALLATGVMSFVMHEVGYIRRRVDIELIVRSFTLVELFLG
jgi:methylsterol monooxygenase